MSVFAENGYAGANLSEIARRAGVAKGTLYLYFETKEDMFRAVARAAVAANHAAVEMAATALAGSLKDLVPMMLARSADRLGDERIPAIARMVIGESRQFPDIARIWHDDVAARMLDLVADVIAAAQSRGEIRSGDPRLHAFSIVGPMMMAVLFREVFGGEAPSAPDLHRLAAQHAETVLNGLLTVPVERQTQKEMD